MVSGGVSPSVYVPIGAIVSGSANSSDVSLGSNMMMMSVGATVLLLYR